MKSQGSPPPESVPGGIRIHNRLHAGHLYGAAMDEAFRVALRGLPGPWDLSVWPVGRAWFRIDVVAPDGASWSMSVPVHEGPRSEDLAETVRVACIRHSRLRPQPKTGRAGAEPDGGGGARPKVLLPPAKATPQTAHDAARGTLK